MVKKKTFLILLFMASAVSTAFSEMTKEQAAEADTLIKQVRMNVKWCSGLAEKLCKVIIAKYPDSDYALEAQRRLANSYLWAKKSSQVMTETDRMIADYAGNPKLPAEMYKLAWECEEFEKAYRPGGDYEMFGGVDGEGYKAAKNIYQQIVQKYPDSNEAGKARLDVSRVTVLSLIKAGKDDEAIAATGNMLANFSEHPDLGRALYDTAKEYEKRGRYDEAAEIYQQTSQTSAHPFRSDKAKLDAAKVKIMGLVAAGDDGNAAPAIDKLAADFSGHPYLAAAVSQVARQYSDKARQLEKEGSSGKAKDCLQKAAAIYEMVTSRLGDSIAYSQTTGRIREYETGTPKAYFELAGCYRRMGEYEKSTQCYKMLMDKYPEFTRTRDAFFLVEQNYLDMSRLNLMSAGGAEDRIRTVYEQFLKKYPDCTTAEPARDWLSRHKVED